VTSQAEEQALRRAVQAGDFEAAASCAHRYTEALAVELRSLPAAAAESRCRAGCELLEWARRCVCAARAHLRDELRRVQQFSAYRHAAASQTLHTWRVDG
jgi:hypothetical protein